MDSLKELLGDNLSSRDVTGNWFVMQWTPDIAIGEKLNIGVGFVQNGGAAPEVRLLDSFDRLSCLYGENVLFQAELACALIKDAFEGRDELPEFLGSQINIVHQGFAQGDECEAVLGQLYANAVPLGKSTQQAERQSPFRYITSDRLLRDVKSTLRKKIGYEASKFIATEPLISYAEGNGSPIYIPFQMPRSGGNVASTVFANADRSKQELLEAHVDLQAAITHKDWLSGGLFVLHKTEDLPMSVVESVDNKLDTIYWLAKKQKIQIEVESNVSDLTDKVIEWAKTQAA